jgi:hypothetical protein
MALDRFDFEQQIMDCWKVTDEIGTTSEGIIEHDLTADQISNILCGLKELYELKFNKLWDCFEGVHMGLVRENSMLNEECAALRLQLEDKEKGKGKK